MTEGTGYENYGRKALQGGEDSDDAMEDDDSNDDLVSNAPTMVSAAPSNMSRVANTLDGRMTVRNVGANKEVKKSNVKKRGKQKAGGVKSKEWILKKKDQMRMKGRDVANHSKFTGRKRKPKF